VTPERRARLITLLDEALSILREDAAATPAPQIAPPAPVARVPATLTAQDYADAATALSCDVATVKAVRDVESNGRGFGPDGRPIILFEPHVFSRLTQHRFDNTHGGVSYPKWGMKPYPKTQTERWAQLEYAMKLDAEAAYQSASWGLFQILGQNYAACGFVTVADFVHAMRKSEREHLLAFVKFVQANHLDGFLRDHRWAAFANGYNGASYQKNAYDVKLAAAYAKHSGA
jgi:hypothetical protein